MPSDRRILLAALVLCLAAGAIAGDSVGFTAIKPEIIQQRLELVQRRRADRKDALESLFREVGCNPAGQPVPHSKAPNLICTLSGETDDTIVVGGHFDSVEVGMGAVDDWSGAVLLPSLYQSLQDRPRRHRFVFVGFAAEESGLLGSREYVGSLPTTERRRIRAMINLECLGLDAPKVWASRADPQLLDAYARVASELHVEARGLNVDGVGDDDSHPFLLAGVPVLTIYSLKRDDIHRILHTSRDNLAAIHPDDYYTAYRVAATYLAFLDSALD